MKKILFTALLFISMGTLAFAQNDGPKKSKKTPEEKAQHAADHLAKKLSLTADQKTKIYAIDLESFKAAKATRVKGQKHDKSILSAEMAKRDQKINEILNDGQRKIYAELKAKKEAEAKNHTQKKQKKAASTEKV